MVASITATDAGTTSPVGPREAGDAYEIELRLKRKQGDCRWHLTRGVPVRNGAGTITHWLGTCTDIDARKRTEDQLRSSTVMLMQSNRELEEFAAVASHDLQEPLRKVQAFADCLGEEQSAALNAAGLTYLDRIQNAATRMATLVADLLELSRLSSKGRPFVSVDRNEIVAGVLSDLEARIARTGASVEVTDLPALAGDPVQMRQLFQNLIGNTLKFHRKDVAAVVRVSAEIVDGVDARRRMKPGGACRISVADNGIGFNEKYLDRVFTIFQRLNGRDVYEGTGIGLAICRKIVERHAGTITARSAPEQGATFIVEVPLLQPHGEHHGSSRPRSFVILLADDDADDRDLTRRALEKSRIMNELHTVADGVELMDYLQHRGQYAPPACSPLPGLILLDLNMPKMDGREALKAIKTDPVLRRIPVIVMTTSKAHEDVLRTYDLGCNSFITKPVTLTALAEVMKVLGQYWFEIVKLPLEPG